MYIKCIQNQRIKFKEENKNKCFAFCINTFKSSWHSNKITYLLVQFHIKLIGNEKEVESTKRLLIFWHKPNIYLKF